MVKRTSEHVTLFLLPALGFGFLRWPARQVSACLLSLPGSPSGRPPSLSPSQPHYLPCHRHEVSPSDATASGPKTSPHQAQLTNAAVCSEPSGTVSPGCCCPWLSGPAGSPLSRPRNPTEDWSWPPIWGHSPRLSAPVSTSGKAVKSTSSRDGCEHQMENSISQTRVIQFPVTGVPIPAHYPLYFLLGICHQINFKSPHFVKNVLC